MKLSLLVWNCLAFYDWNIDSTKRVAGSRRQWTWGGRRQHYLGIRHTHAQTGTLATINATVASWREAERSSKYYKMSVVISVLGIFIMQPGSRRTNLPQQYIIMKQYCNEYSFEK